MYKVFTYRDTFIFLGLGALIILVALFNTLFLNFVFISLWGVHVGFGNRVNNLSKRFEEIDEVNKVVNDESGRKD